MYRACNMPETVSCQTDAGGGSDDGRCRTLLWLNHSVFSLLSYNLISSYLLDGWQKINDIYPYPFRILHQQFEHRYINCIPPHPFPCDPADIRWVQLKSDIRRIWMGNDFVEWKRNNRMDAHHIENWWPLTSLSKTDNANKKNGEEGERIGFFFKKIYIVCGQ